MNTLSILEPFQVYYDVLPMRPLRIRAELGAPVAFYQPVHLDGILSHAVIAEATRGMMLPDNAPLTTIPLPLQVLWRRGDGQPLWASTDFAPVGDAIRSQTYMHRRALDPKMTPRNIDTAAGRHKERRTPLPTMHNTKLVADVIGNPEALSKLLHSVTAIGKKHHSFGAVLRWTIDEADEFVLIDAERRARRPIPVQALGITADLGAAYVGFTPPYWHFGNREFCHDTGMRVPNEAVLP